MLPAHVGASRSTLSALQRDFARLRTLEHPHIARLIELGYNGQQYYVTGERLDGESLRDVLTHLLPERLDVGEADDIVRAVGSALVYAHEHGIAHGDVRAENVLVTMDRRFVLTNFLARRVAKVTSRPPRPSDDVKGLARLAAELYTGSTSPHALRAALHGNVPAARLNAIRAVLEAPSRRTGTVAEFLAAAGLSFAAVRSASSFAAHREWAWSVWRVVWPMAAVTALVGLIVTYQGTWGASAEEIKDRGLDALRAVTARVAPSGAREDARDRGDVAERADAARPPQASAADREPEPAGTPELAADAPEQEPAPAADTPEEERESPATDAEVAATEPEPAPQSTEPAPPIPRPVAAQMARPVAPPPPEPAVVALGVPRIAVREDHSAAAIDIVRHGDMTREITVTWWTVPDTAHPDEDYVSLGRQTVTLAAGVESRRVLIPIVNDGVREAAETFEVQIGRPHGGVSGTVTTTRVTVHDDD